MVYMELAYLDLTLFNHKESSDIMSQMQHATGASSQQMAALRPGLDWCARSFSWV